MDNILVIASSYDLGAAGAAVEGLDHYRTYFFDPTLVDEIAKTSLRRPELLLWEGAPSLSDMERRAHAMASALERQLDEDVRGLLPDDLSLRGWQHLNLYYFFLGWQWYSGMWASMRDKFAGANLRVLVNDNPATFYWPSYVPSLLLMQQLRAWDIPFQAVQYGARADDSDIIMDWFGSSSTRYDVLTHLPTCFYDAAFFQQELTAAGRSVINVEPKYWAVPLAPNASCKVTRLDHGRLAEAGVPSVMAPGQRILQRLHGLLEPYIASADYRARQAAHLARLYQSQLAGFHLLEQHFGSARPGKLLLSDHDAGFHGPLVSYAQRHHLPVFLLPHAKVSISADFSYDNLTALSHQMQGHPLLKGDGKALRHFTLAYPEHYGADMAHRPLKRIGLLLSGLSLNGVQSTALKPYMAGIRAIVDWCRAHDVELSVRCRPGQSLIELLHTNVGLPKDELTASLGGTLASFAQGLDLCLMYDAPTSAAIEFMRNGVAILNPLPEPLSTAENLWSDADQIPREDIATLLVRLGDYVRDPDLFHRFRRRQFATYAAAAAQAHTLRSLL